MTQLNGTVKTEEPEPDPMALEPGPYTVIGYNSREVGPIWYKPSEWYQPFILCRNSIVNTETGPAIVTGVNGSIELEPTRPAQGMQQ